MGEFWGPFWIVLAGALAGASCGLLGAYLVLRKMSLLGDALSHAVLPGIVICVSAFGQPRCDSDVYWRRYLWGDCHGVD